MQPHLVGAWDQKPLLHWGPGPSTSHWFWSNFLSISKVLSMVQFLLACSVFTRTLINVVYTLHHHYLRDHLQYWISFDPLHSLEVTRPSTSHGSTKEWCRCFFECHAPAKVVVLVGSSVGRKLSLRAMESLILFAIRVSTRDGLQGESFLGT